MSRTVRIWLMRDLLILIVAAVLLLASLRELLS